MYRSFIVRRIYAFSVVYDYFKGTIVNLKKLTVYVMANISFYNFIRDQKNITFEYRIEESERQIEHGEGYFDFSVENHPTDDAISVALTCIVGRSNFDKISFELSVHEDIFKEIKAFLQSELVCQQVLPEKYKFPGGNNIILNFSGGMDSLAALSLIDPRKLRLVSLDFGGPFERERVFFSEFSPYTVKTNFRQFPFFRKLVSKNWQFMGVGTLLFSESLKAPYFIFGTILEADPNFNVNVGTQTLPFSSLGLLHLNIIRGITEIATTKIACYFQEQKQINKSLRSLSNPGSVKRFRKDLLVSLFYPDTEVNEAKNFEFGKDYTFDFLLIYVIKKKGYDFVRPYVKNVPQEILNLVNELELTFYERIHPNSLVGLPNAQFLTLFVQNLYSVGINFYTKNDFEELAKVREVLSRLYKQDNRHQAFVFTESSNKQMQSPSAKRSGLRHFFTKILSR